MNLFILARGNDEAFLGLLMSTMSLTALVLSIPSSFIGGSLPALFGYMLHAHPESVRAYRATLLTAEAIMAFGLIPLVMIEEKPLCQTSEPVATLSLRNFPFRRDVIALLIPELIIALGAGLLIPFLNIFFKQRFRIPDSLLGIIFALSQLFTGIATFLAPLLAERLGKIRAVAFTQLASLPFLLMLGFVPLLPVAIGALWLRAMLMNMAGSLYAAFAMEKVHERERGTVGAMIGVAYSVGQSIGPGISGFVQRNFGFLPLFLATGTTYLVAALLTLALFGQAERPVIDRDF